MAPLPSTAAQVALAMVLVRTAVAQLAPQLESLPIRLLSSARTSASSGCVASPVPTPLAISGSSRVLGLANAVDGAAAKFRPGKKLLAPEDSTSESQYWMAICATPT